MPKGSTLVAVCAGLILLFAGVSARAQTPTTRPTVVAAAVPAAVTAVEPADNSYCFTCHTNYQREFLARKHQLAAIGCANCHGESDKHSADENNITPPDTMFAKEKINAACIKCHTVETLLAAEKKKTTAMKGPEHTIVLAGTSTENKYCTDCHGAHTLKVRTRRWDKNTGKLVKDDGVRMMGDAKQ